METDSNCNFIDDTLVDTPILFEEVAVFLAEFATGLDVDAEGLESTVQLKLKCGA